MWTGRSPQGVTTVRTSARWASRRNQPASGPAPEKTGAPPAPTQHADSHTRPNEIRRKIRRISQPLKAERTVARRNTAFHGHTKGFFPAGNYENFLLPWLMTPSFPRGLNHREQAHLQALIHQVWARHTAVIQTTLCLLAAYGAARKRDKEETLGR